MKKNENSSIEIKFLMDDEVAQGIYVNFLTVLHNKAEFVMDFGRIIPGKNEVKIFSRLISNPIAFKQIVLTLNENLKKYEEVFGDIKMDMAPPPPKGIVQ